MQTGKTQFERILQLIIMAGCAMFLLTLCIIAIGQIFYPYELEWMEGGMVDQVARIIAGKPLYAAPALSFVPYTYTPLYLHLCAWASRFTGLSFMTLRLVAFLSTLGCFFMIFLVVVRETRSAFFAFLSCGLFAAMYHLGGSWYAVARADMLLFFLMLVGVYLLQDRKEHILKTAAAAVLFCLAFFCKQTALFVCAPLAVYTLVFFRGVNRIVFPLIVAGLIFAGTWWQDSISDGWFSFYVFELPAHHRLVPFRIASFWIKDILSPLFITSCLCAVYGLSLLRSRNFKKFFFAFLVLGGLVCASFLVRIRTGAFANTVLPAYLGAAVFFGIAAHSVMMSIRNTGVTHFYNAVLLACLAQLMFLFYDPTVQIPTRDDRDAGDHLIELIQRFSGEVYIPAHSHYAVMAGRPALAQQVASYDIERSNRPDIVAPFTNELHSAISTGRFDAIILDHPWHIDAMDRYEYRGDLFNNDVVFWPVTGRRIRPKGVYVRRDLDVDISDLIQGP
ncbi:MAG: hypothetical protein KJ626_07325 [Verrucomicrobia bacterium]|nr:hypothetical protein [Verrucomicrobiota bacterium]